MIIKKIADLRTVCDLVFSIEEANEIIAKLEIELEESNKMGVAGVGLAASQIGINKRVAIVRVGEIKINLVNTTIESGVDLLESEEGCLSLPSLKATVKRFNEVHITNNLVEPHNFVAYGFLATVIQHEMDHFDGKLIIDQDISKTNIGDNEHCPCGKKDPKTNKSLKYKKCCKNKQ